MLSCGWVITMRTFGSANVPSDIVVDEDWYFSQYPDVKSQIKPGLFQSAQHHFVKYGYQEGRIPAKPEIGRASCRERVYGLV